MNKTIINTNPPNIVVNRMLNTVYTTYNINILPEKVESLHDNDTNFSCYSFTLKGSHTFEEISNKVYEEGIEPSIKEWRAIAIHLSAMDYSTLVSAFINARYSSDEMQAIQNNFLKSLLQKEMGISTFSLDDEFIEMQNYREKCKKLAKEILNIEN